MNLNANKQGKIKRRISSLRTGQYGTCQLPDDLTPTTCIVISVTVISSEGYYTDFTATNTERPYWIKVQSSSGTAVTNKDVIAYICYITDFKTA